MPTLRIDSNIPYSHRDLYYVTCEEGASVEEVDLGTARSREVAVVLHGRIPTVKILLRDQEPRAEKEWASTVHVLSDAERPDWLQKDISRARSSHGTLPSKDAETAPRIDRLEICGSGDIVSTRATTIKLGGLPDLIQEAAALSIKSAKISLDGGRKAGQDSAVIFKEARIEASVVGKLTTSSNTTVTAQASRLEHCGILGRLLVDSEDKAELAQCTVHSVALAGQLVVLGDVDMAHIVITNDGMVERRLGEEEGESPRLCVSRDDHLDQATGYGLNFCLEPAGSQTTEQIPKLDVMVSLKGACLVGGDHEHRATALVSVAENATMSECDLTDIALSLKPTAIAEQLSGNCWIANAKRSCLRSHREVPLRVLGTTPADFPETTDSPFEGAVVEGVLNTLLVSAHPCLVAFANCAAFNPFVKNLHTVSNLGSDEERVGVELLNRAISNRATLGSVRTKSAYAAGVARSHLSPSWPERLALACLSWFGFGQLPLRAFFWWMLTVVLSTALACWPYHFQSGLYAWPSLENVRDTFMTMLVEPFNLLKAATDHADSPIPWTGYGLTIQRAILAIAFGHFVVAFARFTRVSFRPT